MTQKRKESAEERRERERELGGRKTEKDELSNERRIRRRNTV